MATRKKVDKAAAKAAKQKKIVIVGSVLLLAVLAIQVPRTMKMLNPQAASAEPPPAQTAPATPPATTDGAPMLPAPGSDPAAADADAAPAGDGILVDSDPVPPADHGQLLVFSRFATKDPFQAQIRSQRPGTAPAAPADEGAAIVSVTPGAGPAGDGPSTAAPATPAALATASIAVNGEIETVAVGANFPAADPTFELLTLTASKATLGVAGGSFADRAKLELVLGKPVTLMNTASGMRYVVELRGAA